jgi:hypothetical protein
VTEASRTRSKLSGPGPFLAEITNHLDKSVMGGLEVVLLQHTPAGIQKQPGTYPVKYLSPFYGVTSARFQGNDSSKFDDSQKSYGMWMVPPDVGTTVMVIFVNSDPNQGYWIGCVPDPFQNYMVPGLAASTTALVTPAQREKYLDAPALPVAEFNKKVYGKDPADPDFVGKPVHPFADVLLKQGLLLDDIRGITSSSARRERPSSVFGISTPGPLDPNGKREKIGYEGEKQTPVSRLGGTTFVMDDGDIYGNNELVRIRTRTGHQLLMHNSKDLIYIANSRGTAWLEFTSEGKIDIYAADSVSIHTEGDFNLKADRDFNLDAGRNFNMVARQTINIQSDSDINVATGDLIQKTINNYSLIVDGNSNIVVGKTYSQSAEGRFSIIANESVAIRGEKNISLVGGQAIQIDSDLTTLDPGSALAKALLPAPDAPDGVGFFTVPGTTPTDGAAEPQILAAMARVPMHEPWIGHEDVAPELYTRAQTDSSVNASRSSDGATKTVKIGGKEKVITAPTVRYRTQPGVDAGVVRGEAVPWTKDKPFLNKVKAVAGAIGIPAIDLIAGMNLETIRTFDPAARNPDSSATGLIQFLDTTIAGLSGGVVKNGRIIQPGSVDVAKLSYMSRVEQMDWVEKYFKGWNWPNRSVPNPTVLNVYLTIFLPASRFADLNEIIASPTFRPDAYEANQKNYDKGKLGYIKPSMIAPFVEIYKVDAIKTLANSGLGPDLEPLSNK